MKKILSNIGGASVLASLLFLVACQSSPSQVVGFGQPLTITGSTNSAPVETNAPTLLIRQINLELSSPGSYAITGFTGNVYLSLNRTSLTDAVLVGSFTVTNFTSLTTNFSSHYTNPPIYVLFSADTGTNDVGVQEIYGP